MNRYLLKGTAVGALGGLLFGFDTAVIAGATHQLAQVYSLSPAQLGFTVAAALIGTVIGAMSAGMIGQKFGGRETLRVMAVLYVVSAVDRVSPGGGRACCWPGLHRRACPRSGAAAWLGCSSSTSWWASCSPTSRTLSSANCTSARRSGWQLGIAVVPAVLFLIMLFGIPRLATEASHFIYSASSWRE